MKCFVYFNLTRECWSIKAMEPDMVTYNPYKGPTFVDKDTGEAVKYSHTAYMCPDRRVYVYGRAG